MKAAALRIASEPGVGRNIVVIHQRKMQNDCPFALRLEQGGRVELAYRREDNSTFIRHA